MLTMLLRCDLCVHVERMTVHTLIVQTVEMTLKSCLLMISNLESNVIWNYFNYYMFEVYLAFYNAEFVFLR